MNSKQVISSHLHWEICPMSVRSDKNQAYFFSLIVNVSILAI